MAEILSGGPPDPGPRTGGRGPARPRRRLVVTAVLVVAAAVALVNRTGSRADPVPPAPPALVATPLQPSVISIAVGARWAYALVATCGAQIVHECDYRLRRRELGGAGWLPTSMRITGRTTTSLGVTLHVGDEDRVMLVQRDESVSLSADGGTTIRTVLLRPGPPIAALPSGGILADGLCATCDDAVTVLDPANGTLRPLAAQPAFPGPGKRLTAVDGDVLWVVQVGPAGTATAVSRDRGRHWRAVPLEGGLIGTDPMVLTAAPGGGAYLVGRRQGSEVPGGWLPDVRRIDGPDGTWQRIMPTTGPDVAYSAAVGERGLLVGDQNGDAWWLQPDGRFRRLAGTPGYLAGGPAGVVLGLPATPRTVLISYDGGASWLAEQVVP